MLTLPAAAEKLSRIRSGRPAGLAQELVQAARKLARALGEGFDRCGYPARSDGLLNPRAEGAHPLVRAQRLERPCRFGEAPGHLARVRPLAQPTPALPPTLHVLQARRAAALEQP